MAIDTKDAQKSARLARIRMSEKELETFTPQLDNIVSWVEQLSELNTDNVDPMPSPVNISLKQREDIINDGNCRDDILANTHEQLEGFIAVPKVVE